MNDFVHDPYYGDDDWYGDPEDYDYDDQWDDDPCSHCGPHCQYWGGDGLCDLEIRALAAYHEFYDKHYVIENYACSVCQTPLTLYKVPSKLWQWPGDWLSPIIALSIYAAYDVAKGVVHQIEKDMYHVWIGTGENGRQCIIATNCEMMEPDAEWLSEQMYGEDNNANRNT